ncbi:MAG: DUF4157 domain-containing protein [Pseudomonadota bacterium]
MAHADGTRARAAQRQPAVDTTAVPGEAMAFADNRADAIAQRETAQAIARSPRSTAQRAVSAAVHASPRMAAQRQAQEQAPPNRTGLPDTLKSGVESLSGMSLDHVKVHYNSSQPAQLNALAYAQGSDIHLGPGQEQHLPHEAWHVVQQAQGRVAPTTQMKSGVPVNDDAGLEREADVMGSRAVQLYRVSYRPAPVQRQAAAAADGVVQRKVGFEFETGWDLRKPGGAAWNTDTPLVRGLNWQMSPDEIAGNNAKIEFKTAPFEVDGDDAAEMIGPIMEAFESLNNYVQTLLPLPEGQFSPIATTPPGVEVQPVGALLAKPQVTGGVRTDLVFAFLKDMASGERDTDLMPSEGNKEKLRGVLGRVEGRINPRRKSSREYWGVVALLANLVVRFQADRTRAVEAYRVWTAETRADLQRRYDAWVVRTHPDEQAQEEKKLEVRAHMTRLSTAKREEIRVALAPSYMKARASALPRVAFNDLPGLDQDDLLRDVLEAAGLTHPDDGALRMFPLGRKSDGDFQETIAQWIASIQQARGGGRGELWSSRSLGTGDVGAGERRGTGIPFELRGIPGPVPSDQWVEFAAPFITYFADINKRRR